MREAALAYLIVGEVLMIVAMRQMVREGAVIARTLLGGVSLVTLFVFFWGAALVLRSVSRPR